MDARPSELDPYPRAGRDLGSVDLWDRSRARSRQRRLRRRAARRNAPRQKGATLAAGAAIFASPLLAPVSGIASSGATATEVAERAAVGGAETRLLAYGDTGEAVAAVQRQLRILEDGIFGPQTEGAVQDFQRLKGLAATGIVDAKTWAELFGSKVLFYDEAGAASSSGETVQVVFDGAGEPAPAAGEPAPEGGPDLEDRVDLRDEIADGAPPGAAPRTDAPGAAPRADAPEAAPPAEAPAQRPAATGGDGCTSDGRVVSPVGGTVTGSFGEDRGDHAHSGTDIAAPAGTTVRAAECGTVSVSGTESGYGTMVCVRHAGQTTTCYAHLSERSVAVNEYVRAGQKIGEVGCTGSCTGPHVHFEVRQGGRAEDPAPYLRGSRTVQGTPATATTTALPQGEGGIGGPTPAEEAHVHGTMPAAEGIVPAKAPTTPATGTGGAAAPEPAAPADAAPIEPAAEAAPVEPVAEAPVEPAVETAPVEATSVEPVVEAAPVEPAVEAAPVEPAVEAAPVELAVEAAPVEPAVEAAPVEPAVEAAPVELAVEAAPVEPAVEAAPVEPAVEAAPVELAVEAAPVDAATGAAVAPAE